ncbi:snake venom vascular endothelial growth factor toxin VR-1' isoform X2 [Megalobrama amblycephala]|uniref:snake venom vascular endothelial growth factor toxin VR-1' isoform X2 n=1 Tax=Megalobrama amblycephala TaxID=75352 RepID=UPI002014818A|nr:snake venom vascular endothelial growth factor toxin VR-1' isoform X2 [Megalobrama amblycephala]
MRSEKEKSPRWINPVHFFQNPPNNSAEGNLYVRSICKPRETIVQVKHEFPEMMAAVLPSCVPVQRCGGCCSDEALVCVSVKNHTTKMQLHARNVHGPVIIELPFVEHSQCECRPRDHL